MVEDVRHTRDVVVHPEFTGEVLNDLCLVGLYEFAERVHRERATEALRVFDEDSNEEGFFF